MCYEIINGYINPYYKGTRPPLMDNEIEPMNCIVSLKEIFIDHFIIGYLFYGLADKPKTPYINLTKKQAIGRIQNVLDNHKKYCSTPLSVKLTFEGYPF